MTKLVPKETESRAALLVLDAGDLHAATAFVIHDEIWGLAESGSAQPARFEDEAEPMRVLLDLAKPGVQVGPESLSGGEGSLGVVIKHLVNVAWTAG
jgi:hypothetical protein